MATQKAEWNSEYVTEKGRKAVVFCVKEDEKHFFNQLRNRVRDSQEGRDNIDMYGSIIFVPEYNREEKAEVQVIRGPNLTLYIIGNETVAIKESFRDFFREATGCGLIFESLTKSEKKERLEQLEREQQKREQEQQERVRQEQKERLKKQIMNSLSPLDFEILELRKKGKSIHGICRKLGVTKGKVEYKLNRMALIPELMKDVDKRFQPLTREERNRLQQTA